ncbi:MAG: ribosome-binding factor A [Myxococcota bacterium]
MPEFFEDEAFGHGRQDRKVYQVCAQAARVLTLAIGDSRNAVVSDLIVVAVQPYPSASRLLVLVQASASVPDRPAILEALAEEKGRLRSAVAETVNRKRAPELIFELAPPMEDANPWD